VGNQMEATLMLSITPPLAGQAWRPPLNYCPGVQRSGGGWLGLKAVCEQEMLDDDLGFSDVTVEVAKTVHVVPINKLIKCVIRTRQARAK
jgi:hypothetical protein